MWLQEVLPMLNVISFEIPGPVRGKARPRVTHAGITYTPKETVQYENLVKLCFREAAASGTVDLFDKPVRAQLEVYHEIPKSTSKSRQGAMDVIGKMHIVLGDGIYIDSLNLIPCLQNQIRSMAAFDNPV